MNQRQLFEQPSPRELAWRKFHATNPGVFAMFERFALEALRNGARDRVGARMVWERMRWETTIAPVDATSAWRLNDHHVPYYARLFMERHPRLGRVFEVRQRSEKTS